MFQESIRDAYHAGFHSGTFHRTGAPMSYVDKCCAQYVDKTNTFYESLPDAKNYHEET